VIGTGFVGPFHVDAVRRGGYADVAVLAGSDDARTSERAAALGVPSWTTDLDDLMADDEIDVVHVCTPNRTHVQIATAALEAGKHVVVEKPVATDGGSARALAELARERGRHAGVALTYRGYAMVRRARELVASGEIGSVRLVHGGYVQDWLADPEDYNWRLEPEVGGASRAVADIGTHWFDLAEFITGQRVTEVFADLATFIKHRQRPVGGRSVAFQRAGGAAETVEVRSEDAATVLLRFTGGALGSCVVSQVSPGHKNTCQIEVAGSRRSVGWEQERGEELWLRARDASQLLVRGPEDGAPAGTPGVPALPAGHPEGWVGALTDLFRPFYAAILADEPVPGAGAAAPYPTLDDGARGVAYVEAVLRSSREARWVELTAA
jgi:predicted dehydrogenase